MKWLRELFRAKTPSLPLFLFNTLGGKKQQFKPLEPGVVRMYNCGPTVYGRQHIGNLSMFVFVDVLRRALEWNGYRVQQVINFTDVGHLVSDGDEGEDKMTKGLKREGMTPTLENMKVLGKKYAEDFLGNLKLLNIDTDGITFPYASDYIQEQIEMVKALEEKGYAYRGAGGVYYDTDKFRDYGKLGNINLAGLREGARVDVASDRRHPSDFLLWKFDSALGWDSPWGKGFPGWHIECSAMSRSILGDQIDIHTGGIEHIPVHHNNEIAQSEAATGKEPFSRFWLHRAHLQIEGAKIAKSEGNTIYLSEIEERGFSPLAFRYLLLGSHYRTPASFTWEALRGAQTALERLYNLAVSVQQEKSSAKESAESYQARFAKRINDDLDTPGALAAVWEMMKDTSVSAQEKYQYLLAFDSVLGIGIKGGCETLAVSAETVPDEVKELLTTRERARTAKEWDAADRARRDIESRGYTIEDTPDGARLKRR